MIIGKFLVKKFGGFGKVRNFALRNYLIALLLELEKQLKEYFAKERKEFTLPITLVGTPFQEEVWKVLQTIPYGETRTYKEQAIAVGNPKGVRAVANANSKNRLSIIVPCHRVIGSNGTLTGYAGGLSRKEFLLNLEKSNS